MEGFRTWINSSGAVLTRWVLGVVTAVALSSINNYFQPHWQVQADNTAAIAKVNVKLDNTLQNVSVQLQAMDERLSRIEGQMQRDEKRGQ